MPRHRVGRIVHRMLSSGGFLRSGRGLWAVCAVVVLIVFARGGTLVWQLRRDALASLQHDTEALGGLLAAQTSRYLQLVDTGLRRMRTAGAQLPDSRPETFHARFGGEESHRFMRELLQNLPQANAFLMIDGQGKLVSTSRVFPAPFLDDSDRAFYLTLRRPTEPDLYVSLPTQSRAVGSEVLFLARRLVAADGQFAGVAVAVLDVDYFRQFYEALNVGDSRDVALSRGDGAVLVRFPATEPDLVAPILDKAAWDSAVAAGGGTYRTERPPKGTPTIVSVHPLADFPLVIEIALRERAALAPWVGLMRVIMIQSVVAAAALIALFAVIVRQFKTQAAQTAALAGTAVALGDSEQRLREFAELASDWFWEQDAELRFSWTSPTSPAHRLGLTSDGRTRWEQVGALPTDPEWVSHVSDLHARRPFRDFRYERAGIEGEIRHVSISGAPVFDAGGQFVGYRGTGRDVTAEVAAERDLRDARDRAEAANRAKSEFLANMSHELRTPLNAIIGFSELIATQPFGKIEPRYADFAADILASGKHLLELINDLLDMAKIEAGQMPIADERVDLAPLIRSCAAMMAPRAEEGGVVVTVAAGADGPMLRGDRRAIRQILLNLVSNAVKFTQRGGSVELRAEATADGFALVVRDTGIGISKDALSRLGEAFQQADATISRRFGGTGLGLAITRKLLALHGGTLRFDSEPGAGTTVWAVFPAERILASD